MSELFNEVKRYVGFDEEDSKRLRNFLPLAQPHLQRISEDFYDRIDRHPEARSVITGGEDQIERLKRTLVEWMRSGLAGPHDPEFFERRARIGRRHVRIALPQRYMFTAMNGMRTGLQAVLNASISSETDQERREATRRALDRLLDLELCIMLETYKEASDDRLRAAEQARGDAREKTLVDTVQALLLVLDESGRVVQSNAAVSALCGVSDTELRGRHWITSFTAPPDRPEAQAHFEALLEGGPPAEEYLERLLPPGVPVGEARWVRWQCSIVEVRGELRIYRSGVDVTRTRELEQRTRLAERLAAVGTMSAGLAHEIRNPLNAAGLQLQLLERRLLRSLREAAVARDRDGTSAPSGEEAGDNPLLSPVRLVQAEIERLSRLVTEFLDFARPRGSAPQRVDLGGLAEDAASLVEPEFARRGIELELVGSGLDVYALADEAQVQQVLLNLLRNAREACVGEDTGEPAQARSRRPCVFIELESQGDRVSLRVRDEGPGVAAEHRVRIFEPFFTTRPSGTGLGLSLCHRLIDQNGGELRLLEPEEGSGACFEICLPAA